MSYSRIPTTRLLRVTVAVRLVQGTAPMDSYGTDSSYYAIPTMCQPSAAVTVSGDPRGCTAPRAVSQAIGEVDSFWQILFVCLTGSVVLWFEEEKLVEMVSKYLCLYDLSVYKNQPVKESAWTEVVTCLS